MVLNTSVQVTSDLQKKQKDAKIAFSISMHQSHQYQSQAKALTIKSVHTSHSTDKRACKLHECRQSHCCRAGSVH